MALQLPNEINERTRVPLMMVVGLVAGLVSAAMGYAGQQIAINEKPDKEVVRVLAREEIRAANVANGTDVAVIANKVDQLEKAVNKLATEQEKTNDLLRRLADK